MFCFELLLSFLSLFYNFVNEEESERKQASKRQQQRAHTEGSKSLPSSTPVKWSRAWNPTPTTNSAVQNSTPMNSYLFSFRRGCPGIDVVVVFVDDDDPELHLTGLCTRVDSVTAMCREYALRRASSAICSTVKGRRGSHLPVTSQPRS